MRHDKHAKEQEQKKATKVVCKLSSAHHRLWVIICKWSFMHHNLLIIVCIVCVSSSAHHRLHAIICKSSSMNRRLHAIVRVPSSINHRLHVIVYTCLLFFLLLLIWMHDYVIHVFKLSTCCALWTYQCFWKQCPPITARALWSKTHCCSRWFGCIVSKLHWFLYKKSLSVIMNDKKSQMPFAMKISLMRNSQ